MNSPLGLRKVRLRGLGGRAACGVPRTCASAASEAPPGVRGFDRLITTFALSHALSHFRTAFTHFAWIHSATSPIISCETRRRSLYSAGVMRPTPGCIMWFRSA